MILVVAAAVSAQTTPKGETAHLSRSSGGEKRAPAAGKKGKRSAPGVLRLGPSTTYLKNGLRADEVLRFLGRPASVSERQDGDLHLATYTFARGEGRVLVAEFENGLLVSSRMGSGESLVRNRESGQ